MTGRAVSEKHWLADVVEVATMFGWAAYHTFDSRHSAAGFPDLVLCRPPRVVFAELKTDAGRVGSRQREWLDRLAACPGVESYLWRPSDLDDVLAALAPAGVRLATDRIGAH